MTSKRINSISLLRLLSCLSIFIYHYFVDLEDANPNIFFPAIFFVLIFSFISGFLYSNKNIEPRSGQWILKNIKKLAIPCIIYIFLTSIIILIIGLSKSNGDFNYAIKGFVDNNSYSNQPNFVFGNLWFVIIIAIAYCFTPSLYKITHNLYDKKKKIILASIILVISISDFVFNFFVPAFAIYVIGYIIGNKYYEKITFGKGSFYIYLILTILFIGLILFWYLLNNYICETSYMDFGRRIGSRIIGSIISISFSIVFLRIFSFVNKFNKLTNIFKITDKYCFLFYMTHQSFLVGSLCFYDFIKPSFLYIFIIFILSIIYSILIEQTNMLLSNYLLKSKK